MHLQLLHHGPVARLDDRVWSIRMNVEQFVVVRRLVHLYVAYRLECRYLKPNHPRNLRPVHHGLQQALKLAPYLPKPRYRIMYFYPGKEAWITA